MNAATDADDPRKRETEALIEAIWGPRPEALAAPADPALRRRQNEALAVAMTAYLQKYLEEAAAHAPRVTGRA